MQWVGEWRGLITGRAWFSFPNEKTKDHEFKNLSELPDYLNRAIYKRAFMRIDCCEALRDEFYDRSMPHETNWINCCRERKNGHCKCKRILDEYSRIWRRELWFFEYVISGIDDSHINRTILCENDTRFRATIIRYDTIVSMPNQQEQYVRCVFAFAAVNLGIEKMHKERRNERSAEERVCNDVGKKLEGNVCWDWYQWSVCELRDIPH